MEDVLYEDESGKVQEAAITVLWVENQEETRVYYE